MNCRPGDMAVVVSTRINAEHRLPRELLGAVVTVVTISEMVCDNLPVWQLKAPVHFVAERHYSMDGTLIRPGDEVALSRLPDSVLQPIRGLPVDRPAKLFANV